MIKILQITDLHIGADSKYRLAGVDTLHTFNSVVDQAQKEDYDLVMVTGDISAEANLSAYETFFTRVRDLDSTVLWLPGNHDLMPSISQVPNAIPFQEVYDLGDWRIIMLDSIVEYHPGGELGIAELGKLQRLLDENTKPNVLISLHHQPIDVGSHWLDKQKIQDAKAFLSIVESNKKVRGVLWGHVHQAFETKQNGCYYMATPSTCVQFKVNSHDFALDTLSPGYRLLHLHPDGAIDTKIQRVDVEGFEVDVHCVGY